MSENYNETTVTNTPRDVMLPLLSQWTGVAQESLEKYETEELRGYFERAADPFMCLVAGGAGLTFAYAAALAIASKNYVTAAFMVAGALLDGGVAIYRRGQLKEVRRELKAREAQMNVGKPPTPSCCGGK